MKATPTFLRSVGKSDTRFPILVCVLTTLSISGCSEPEGGMHMKRRKRSRRCYLKSCARLTKIWSNTSQMSDTRMQILRRPGVNFAQVWSEFCAGWSEFCAGSGEFCAGLGEFGADSKSFLAISGAVTPAIGKTPLPVGLSASTIVAINGSRYRLPCACRRFDNESPVNDNVQTPK